MNALENKEKRFVSFVICACNEEGALVSFLEKLHDFADRSFGSWEIIVVDNGGTDQLAARVQKTAQSFDEGVLLIHLPWHHDPELAMLAGTELAVGDLVFE